MSNRDYCRFLNQWVYHTKIKYNINEHPLSMFYLASHANIVRNGGENICPYYSYDTTLEEPLNIIKLENFQEDMQTIESILKRENDSITSCQKYICECVNIYKKMHNKYCTHAYKEHKKREDTCDKLKAFESAYMSFLFSNKTIRSKIPSLYAAENEHILICPSAIEKQAQELKSIQKQEPGSGLEPEPKDNLDSAEQSGSTIPFNATAVVGTMIGIPPFLGLIYRVNIMFT
ncbi:hypothetical protein PVIIG_06116 [Plasmodium vivax India VII]|uniref:Uncharacterized protein n=1 Tax=Plasmodium vivax India VII TaxID=1077284 RepID=A0A0J9S366_PLAVI|nr:hypothetical protein PVIIG_06116 [Plasmodium vivax India VII]